MLENSSGDVPRARRQRGAAVQHKGVSHLRFAVRWFCPPPGSWPRRPMAGDRVLMTARDRWRGSSAAGVLAIAIGLFVAPAAELETPPPPAPPAGATAAFQTEPGSEVGRAACRERVCQ